MGLQETLRRTRAPNTTHVVPCNAPAANLPAQCLSTPVPARGGECVLGREARRGGYGAGAVRRGPRHCGNWRRRRCRRFRRPPSPPSSRPLTCAGQGRELVSAQARGEARRLCAGVWAGPLALLLLLSLTLRLLPVLPQPLWLRPTRRF